MFLGVAVQVVANVVIRIIEFGYKSSHAASIIADPDARRFY